MRSIGMKMNRVMMAACLLGTIGGTGAMVKALDDDSAARRAAIDPPPPPKVKPAGGGARERARRLARMSKKQEGA
jgi:hypothetical protein